MANPKVSVLLPAYQSEPFVDAAVRSIVEQTFSDFELVASDDASSDRTVEILESWAARDPRVRVVRNERNVGMTANWNRALREARGDLVIKLDADDVFRPRAVEVLVDALAGNALAAGCRTLACDPQLEPFDGLPGDDAIMHGGIDPYKDHDLETGRWYPIAGAGHQLWHSDAVMWRRAWLAEQRGWNERFGCGSDTDLIWRTLETPGVFAHRAYVGVLYRIRPGSVSDTYRSRGWLTWEGTVANLVSLDRYRRSHPLSRTLRMRYASLWRRWHEHVADNERKLPPQIFANLAGAVAELSPPPRVDVLLLRAREAVAVSRA